MGGEGFYLPKIDRLLRWRRNQLIKADLEYGLSYKKLARKYRLTERGIRDIEKEIKEDRQTELLPMNL